MKFKTVINEIKFKFSLIFVLKMNFFKKYNFTQYINNNKKLTLNDEQNKLKKFFYCLPPNN